MKTIGLKVRKPSSKASKKAQEKSTPADCAPKNEGASTVKKKGEKPSAGAPADSAPKDGDSSAEQQEQDAA